MNFLYAQVYTNFQLAKTKTKKAVSAKHNKMRHNEVNYVCNYFNSSLTE